jgi:hypothetical protein
MWRASIAASASKLLTAWTIGSALFATPAVAADTALLSVKGIHLDESHHLTKVVIRTWGVEVLAVCQIPKVSRISVDFDLDPGGVLTWKASSWHGELDRWRLDALSSLFLVRVSDYQRYPRGNPRRDYHPASFEGSAIIATVKEPTRERTIQLRPGNFGLVPAARCPDPH